MMATSVARTSASDRESAVVSKPDARRESLATPTNTKIDARIAET